MTYINYFFMCIKMNIILGKRKRSDTQQSNTQQSNTHTFTAAESKTTNTDLLKAIRDGKKMFELTSGKKLGRKLGSGSYGSVFAILKQKNRCVKIEVLRSKNTADVWTASLALSRVASEIKCGPTIYDTYTHPVCVSANQEHVCFGYTIMERCAKLPDRLTTADFHNIFHKVKLLGLNRIVCFDLKPDNTLKKLGARDFYITDYGSQFCRADCPPGTEQGYIFLMQLMVSIVFFNKGYMIPNDFVVYFTKLPPLNALTYRFACYKMINWYVYRSKTDYARTRKAVDIIYTHALNNPGKPESVFVMVHQYMSDSYLPPNPPPPPPPALQLVSSSSSSYKLKF